MENATVVEESHTLYGTALLEYVQQNSPVSPTAEDRIRRVNAEVEPESKAVREGTAVITLPAPEGTRNVSDGFYATTGDPSERLDAESVALEDGMVEVRFDAAELRRLAGDGDGAFQLYGEYNSSAYDRVYFEHSVLNANVAASNFAAQETTATTTGRPETSFTTATASDSDGSVPGFTPITAIVALLGAAFVALRRT